MNNLLDKVHHCGIIPVVAINNSEDAVPLAQALLNGGINVIEITFRTQAASEAIRKIKAQLPEMTVLAGTVLNVEQANVAIKMGAEAIISPCYDEDVVDYCLQNEYLIIPGIMTPSEMNKAMKKGINTVKLFPAEVAGGVKMLNSVAATFPDLKFMPTGGLKPENVESYLKCPNVFACGGTWLAKTKLIEEHDFQTIEKLSAEASEIVHKVRE